MAALLGKLFPALARPSSRREELAELLQESVGDKASLTVTKVRYYKTS